MLYHSLPFLWFLFGFSGWASSYWSPPQGVSKPFHHPDHLNFPSFGQPLLETFELKLAKHLTLLNIQCGRECRCIHRLSHSDLFLSTTMLMVTFPISSSHLLLSFFKFLLTSDYIIYWYSWTPRKLVSKPFQVSTIRYTFNMCIKFITSSFPFCAMTTQPRFDGFTQGSGFSSWSSFIFLIFFSFYYGL